MAVNYFDIGGRRNVIQDNPQQRHNFQPVHKAAICECNVKIDGAVRKYLAYDSDQRGGRVNLYYTDDLDREWTPYLQGSILSDNSRPRFRWPSVVLEGDTFHMFLDNYEEGALERWESHDGISYTRKQVVLSVKQHRDSYINPFVWFYPNDGKCYLYYRTSYKGIHRLAVRAADSPQALEEAEAVTIMERPESLAAPSVMYAGGYYWLAAESKARGYWDVEMFYSTAPTEGYQPCNNSPLFKDEACPIHILGPGDDKVYLYTNYDFRYWFQGQRSCQL